MQGVISSLTKPFEKLKELAYSRIYDGNTQEKHPHVKRLLLERYFFKIPKEIIPDISDEMYEEHTLRTEWKEDPSSGLKFEVYHYDTEDGEKIFTETFRALARRTAKRIASGILNVDKLVYEGSPEDYELTRFVENAQDEEKLELLNEVSKMFEFAIYHKIWLPSSPFMMNAAREAMDDPEMLKVIYKDYEDMTLEDYKVISRLKDPAYGSCYAMGTIEDDIKSIFDMLYYQAEVFRHAGGFGVNFGKLRSKYAWVSTIKGRSSGPLMFMRLFNEVTYIIALHANTKRGANMFLMDVKHPEILEFINLKSDFEKGYQNIKYANVSVAVENDYINSLLNDEKWELVDPHDENIRIEEDPKKIWTNLIYNATLHAEPGLLNLSAINKDNPIVDIEPITSVNPCAEFTGFDESVCVLGSVNFYSMIVEKNGEISFDMKGLEAAVRSLHLFLTLAGAANEYPLETLTRKTRMYRNVGIGYMGLASSFVMLNQSYGSKESFETFRRIMRTFSKSVVRSSMDMADLIGPHAYFNKNRFVMSGKELKELFKWHRDGNKFEDGKRYYVWNTDNPDATVELPEGKMIANARLMAIAPTGSISYICQVSSGVEPIFSLAYTRRINPDLPAEYTVVVYDSSLEDYLRYYRRKSEDEIEETIRKIANFDVPEYIEEDPILVTTSQIGMPEKIAILMMSNLYIDMNTSTTFNIQRDTKLGEMEKLADYDEPFLKRALEIFNEKRFDVREYVENHLLSDPHHIKAFLHFISMDPTLPNSKAEEYRDLMVDLSEGLTTPNDIVQKIKGSEEYEKAIRIIQTVSDFYLMSMLLNIKGTTIYVEATRTPILKLKRKKKEEKKKDVAIFDLGGLKIAMDTKTRHLVPKQRPAVIPALKKEVKFTTNGNMKKMYVELGYTEDNEPFEVFFRAGTSTKEYTELFNTAGRLMSLAMRSGVDVSETLRQMRKVKDWENNYSPVTRVMADTVEELTEILKAKGKKREEMMELEERKKNWVFTAKGYYIDEEGRPRCPVCGGELVMKDGCAECHTCGWTACTDN